MGGWWLVVGDWKNMFTYRAVILEQLLVHGVRPTSATPPALVYEFVGDLYRFRLRQLRDRLRRQEFPKADYYGLVVEMRMRYRILAMKPSEWLVDNTRNGGVHHVGR